MMSGHRRRSRQSPDASSSARYSRRHRSPTPISIKDDETDASEHHRRRRWSNKRSFGSSSAAHRSPASRPRWAILNVAGARRDEFHGAGDDHTTLAMSCTSKGEMISVSFDLVEPPGISVLALAWPRGPSPVASTRPEVVAAHRDVVLVEMACAHRDLRSTRDAPVDYFVYQAGSDTSELPSLSLLPTLYDEERCFAGRPMQLLLTKDSAGIMSCRSKEDSSSSFVVADLSMTHVQAGSPPAIEVSTFQSRSGEWKTFKNIHVHGANGGRDLRFWNTDAIVPDYRGRFLIWLDYYRGMMLMDILSSESQEKNSPEPRLRYLPLPVETVGDPEDNAYHSRGCPEKSRSVCATRSGIKFVSVDRQHCSNWGVGHENVLTWNHTFRVTTWSLREDDYTWRRDGTMYEEEFWATVDSGKKKRFPRVPPGYPIVDMENPDAICFQLKKNSYRCEEPKWMIEVDMRKKVLLAATAYSMESSSYGDKHSINSARTKCEDVSFSTELPRYLDGGQSCKKRRQ